jgi:hypothetical protein
VLALGLHEKPSALLHRCRLDGDLDGTLEEDLVDLLDGPGGVALLALHHEEGGVALLALRREGGSDGRMQLVFRHLLHLVLVEELV